MKPPRFVRSAAGPLIKRLDRRIDVKISRALADLPQTAPAPAPLPAPAPAMSTERPHKIYVPSLETTRLDESAPYMEYSTCSASDFMHPEFARVCAEAGIRLRFLRKLWEYGFIVHHLEKYGALSAGSRGVVFGVGAEPLPAVFAARGCEIVATDAPLEVADEGGWREYRHSEAVEALTNNGVCDPDVLRDRVTHRLVDMNAIPDDLSGFDFCWSACCFEHLGSLQAGLDFVVDSVETSLKPGGIAVHTTELNLSSNDATLESPNLSIYRRRDLDELIERLRSRGHTVDEIVIAPDSSYLDQYVDVRPFSGDLHLKLELAGYTTTSVGLVIRRSERVTD